MMKLKNYGKGIRGTKVGQHPPIKPGRHMGAVMQSRVNNHHGWYNVGVHKVKPLKAHVAIKLVDNGEIPGVLGIRGGDVGRTSYAIQKNKTQRVCSVVAKKGSSHTRFR